MSLPVHVVTAPGKDLTVGAIRSGAISTTDPAGQSMPEVGWATDRGWGHEVVARMMAASGIMGDISNKGQPGGGWAASVRSLRDMDIPCRVSGVFVANDSNFQKNARDMEAKSCGNTLENRSLYVFAGSARKGVFPNAHVAVTCITRSEGGSFHD